MFFLWIDRFYFQNLSSKFHYKQVPLKFKKLAKLCHFLFPMEWPLFIFLNQKVHYKNDITKLQCSNWNKKVFISGFCLKSQLLLVTGLNDQRPSIAQQDTLFNACTYMHTNTHKIYSDGPPNVHKCLYISPHGLWKTCVCSFLCQKQLTATVTWGNSLILLLLVWFYMFVQILSITTFYR